LYHI